MMESLEKLRNYVATSLADNAYILEESYQQKLEACTKSKDLWETHRPLLDRYNKAVLNWLRELPELKYLKDDQLKMVSAEDRLCLVTARAGTGKSSTLTACVSYLLHDIPEANDAVKQARDALWKALRDLIPELPVCPGKPRKAVDPNKILVMSYNNSAVNKELTHKFRKANIPIRERKPDKPGVTLRTFHKLGKDILVQIQADEDQIDPDEEPVEVVKPDLPKFVKDFVIESLKGTYWSNRLPLFFAKELDFPGADENQPLYDFYLQKANAIYANCGEEDLQQELDERQKKQETLQGERVRSQQEAVLADFLYLHGIDYDYECCYMTRDGTPYTFQGSNKPYTPDFTLYKKDKSPVYYEHFGMINENPSPGENKAYRERCQRKIQFMNGEGVSFLYTWCPWIKLNPTESCESGKSVPREDLTKQLLGDLSEKLVSAGFQLKAEIKLENFADLFAQRRAENSPRRFSNLVGNFLQKLEDEQKDCQWLDAQLKKTENPRTRVFLEFCRACYAQYTQQLAGQGLKEQRHEKIGMEMTYDQMIGGSAQKLCEQAKGGPKKIRMDYQYIFVDEFQDISQDRFELLKNLAACCGRNTRIMVIGDDWQTINGYAGAIPELFTEFPEHMSEPEEKIEECGRIKFGVTFRNPQSIVHVAETFMGWQGKETVSANRDKPGGVFLYTYDGEEERALEHILEKISNDCVIDSEEPQPEVLFLGRYNKDLGILDDHFERIGQVGKKETRLTYVSNPDTEYNNKFRFRFSTIHSAKGAEADEVILLSGSGAGEHTFPSMRRNDPVMSLVSQWDEIKQMEEERRLFYVALTRTKNRVFCLVPRKNTSAFLTEILKNDKEDKSRVFLLDETGQPLKEDPEELAQKKPQYAAICPVCGKPLQHIRQIRKWDWKKTKTEETEDQNLKSRLHPHGGPDLFHLYVCTDGGCNFITTDPSETKPLIWTDWEKGLVGYGAPITLDETRIALCPDDATLLLAVWWMQKKIGYTYRRENFTRLFRKENWKTLLKEKSDTTKANLEAFVKKYSSDPLFQDEQRLSETFSHLLNQNLLCNYEGLGPRMTALGLSVLLRRLILRFVKSISYSFTENVLVNLLRQKGRDDKWKNLRPEERINEIPESVLLDEVKEGDVWTEIKWLKKHGYLREKEKDGFKVIDLTDKDASFLNTDNSTPS